MSMFSADLGGAAFKKAKSTVDANLGQTNSSTALTQSQWADYRKYNQPSTDELTKLANDTSIVDSATKRADGLHEANAKQVDRVTGRRVTSMTAAQRRSIRDRLATVSSTDGASSIYNSRLMQRDVNNAAVNSAMDVAATMDSQALAALTSADSLKASRDAQNAANARAAKGGFMSTLGTLAGAGIGYMVSGNTMGAQLGASLGGSAGSMFG